MASKIIQECEQSMDKRIKAFESDLTKVRTGRASIAVLDRVRVDYYGAPTPLNQVASLSTPDARTIAIAPFEKSLISEIEKGILKSDLGFSPTNDGNIVRIPIPQLTEERRKDIVKNLKKMAEEVKVSLRKTRKDANDTIKNQEKEKAISEDDRKKLENDIQKITDKFVKAIDDKLAVKEKEVMTV
jgi:ribosome recycling factor